MIGDFLGVRRCTGLFVSFLFVFWIQTIRPPISTIWPPRRKSTPGKVLPSYAARLASRLVQVAENPDTVQFFELNHTLSQTGFPDEQVVVAIRS